MSNNAINKTLTPLIILLLEQNTLGANHLILHKYENENKQTKTKTNKQTKNNKKDIHAFFILYT